MSGNFRIGGGIATTMPVAPVQTAAYAQPVAASMPYIGGGYGGYGGSYGSMAAVPLNGNGSLTTIPATAAPGTASFSNLTAPPVATIGSVIPVTSQIAPMMVGSQSIVAPPPVGSQTIYPTIPRTMSTSIPQIRTMNPVASYGSVTSLPASRVSQSGGYIPGTSGGYIPGTQSGGYIPGTEQTIGPSYDDRRYEEDGGAPPQTMEPSGFDPLMEPEDEVDDADDQEMSGQWKFKGITKPRTKWRTGKEVKGDWPIEHPQASHGIVDADKIDIPRAVEMRQKQQRTTDTPNEMSKIQEDKPWPFWIGAGTPTARLEPTWIDGSWYLVAPVDFKGIDKLPKEIQHGELNTVDDALRILADEDRIPALPPPRHWKEHKNCPIA